MQVENTLKGKVYIDHSEKKIYVDSNATLRDSRFLTLYKEYRGYKIIVDASKVSENRQAVERFSGEEEILNEISKIIHSAAEKKVSDIHIEVKDKQTSIYFREDGLLKKVYEYSAEEGERICQALYSNAVATSHSSFAQTEYQYANIRKASLLHPSLEGIRLQRGPMLGGQFVVLRLLYKASALEIIKGENFRDTVLRTFTSYGYRKETAEIFEKVLRGAEGLMLIAGPTGSGKSTALKLSLELIHLLYPTKSIFTIEDPPEYRITGAKQLPVPESGKFSEVLRVAMRSDPDIIMVGEIRDPETAKVIVDAVLTGHMVLSTVHAVNVYTIFERLKKLGVDVEEIIDAGLVRVAVSQRLVPAVCPNCKEFVKFPDGIEGYVGRGCEHCGYTGVKGRVVVEEAISQEHIKKYGLEGIREYLKENKKDLISNAIRLVKEGKISPIHAMGYVGYFSAVEFEYTW